MRDGGASLTSERISHDTTRNNTRTTSDTANSMAYQNLNIENVQEQHPQ